MPVLSFFNDMFMIYHVFFCDDSRGWDFV